jgi:hypothetical protein
LPVALCAERLELVARRKQVPEALDEGWMASEEGCDTVDEAGSVDAERDGK